MQIMETTMATLDNKTRAPRAAYQAPDQKTITGPTTLLFACATGVIVTNLFAPQPLTGLIGPSLGLSLSAAGSVSMLTLLGYATGLFFLVPLADLITNRPLILLMLCAAVATAMVAAVAPNAAVFLPTTFALGVACSAIQMLVPVAASMASPEQRGRIIGDVMSGLMIGILLSRPLASIVADSFGWRAFYAISAAGMAAMTLVLVWQLPNRHPMQRGTYVALIASLWTLLRTEPVLRRRAATASLSMGAFSVFWTAIALRLSATPFNLDQRGIALFALVGAAGAVVAPLAGRAGDRGWTRATTFAAHVGIIAAFALAAIAGADGIARNATSACLVMMGLAAVLLDASVTGDQTLGRRAVNLLSPEARGRLNGLFVGIFFLGGAIGSAVASLAWAQGGWPAVCATGAAFGAVALVAGLTYRA
jgi:predicted MFS family arabinose efflux permease